MDVNEDAGQHRDGSDRGPSAEFAAPTPADAAPGGSDLAVSAESLLATTPVAAPGDTMTVEVGGETRTLRVHVDYTGDGKPDAAIETEDGRVVVFSDQKNNDTGAAGPDGRADEAFVVDKETGRVIAAVHLDPETGQWMQGSPPEPSADGADPTR